ncbi:MAG TPA: redoxin domain-containing protein [Myxococcales bacterium]|nr:redoxin domain-containing protein [Myxococcales bacterium]
MATSPSEPVRQVPDFVVRGHDGRRTRLSTLAAGGPLVLLVHPGLGDPRSLELLMEYRDRGRGFRMQGMQIAALSPDEPSALDFLRSERGLPFALLSDEGSGAISALGGLVGSEGLAVLLLDRARFVRHRPRAPLGSADGLLLLVKRGAVKSAKRPFPRLGGFVRDLIDLVRHRPWTTRPAR